MEFYYNILIILGIVISGIVVLSIISGIVISIGLMISVLIGKDQKYINAISYVFLMASLTFLPAVANYGINKYREITKPKPIKIITSVLIERVQILKVTPPTHVYVDLKIISGGTASSIYVSKHCTNKIEGEYNLKIIRYYFNDNPSMPYVSFPDIQTELCG